MRLNELELSQLLKNPHDQNPDTVAIFLHRLGWKGLGSGVDATVFQHPHKPYALKVFYEYSQYQHFVRLVQHNSQNPHFPKFSRYIRPVPHTKMKYVRMELLKPVGTMDKLLHDFLPEVAFLCYQGFTRGRVPFSMYGYLASYMNKRYNIQGDYLNQKFDPQYWQRVFAVVPQASDSWKKACQLTINFLENIPDAELDLHEDNVMLRGTTLVITDPYAGEIP